MPPLPFNDIYHLRKVAESSSKPCFICYKPTTAVLVSEDGKADFFYACEVHLQDSNFATAKIDPEVELAKEKQKKLDAEIELLKKKWDQRQKAKEKDKSKDSDKKKEEGKDKDNKNSDKTTQAELGSLESEKKVQDSIASKSPRVYIVNRSIHNIRLEHWRNIQRSKQTQKLLQDKNLFPKVPTHSPSPPPAPSVSSSSPPPPPTPPSS
ncbi:hypothetical protein AWJ20_3392 [Sugiyamaella lignohabitans]|uniref:VPS4-associated protein 1 n=1 Tax=Sugiyamaella lignohabitans TaxID=796027 RepID=A0A167FVE6_9ASCO|nr:uncharacterized protein AWJ20_3392 [Sugiyamaella lignohabitans]ANB15748.1 hypothetical protein AWJ20_3392 [Sugiyamaella lignohabitans]